MTGEKKLEKVWWALASDRVEVFDPPAADRPFAVKVEVRPPLGRRPVLGNLVKGIFDGGDLRTPGTRRRGVLA
jgi:hypothetical protein